MLLLLQDNRQAFDLVAEACALEHVFWKHDPDKSSFELVLPGLRRYRQLGKLLALAAGCALREGRCDLAVDRIRQQLRLADLVERLPSLVSHLVAAGIRELAVDVLQQFLADPQAFKLLDPAAALQCRDPLIELCGLLQQEESAERGLVQALATERLFQVDAARMLIAGRQSWSSLVAYNFADPPTSVLERAVNWWMRPLLKMDTVRLVRHMNGIVAACWLPSLPQVRQRVQWLDLEVDRSRYSIRRLTRPLSAVLMPSLSGAVLTHFRQLDAQRRTAVELAVRLYEWDHGRRPAELSDLVPDYLRDVPINLAVDPPRAYALEDLPAPSIEE